MSGLKKAFERKMKGAEKWHEINQEFNMAIGDSKYADLVIPDDVVECIDYAGGTMTYKEFIESMNEALEESKED